MATLFANVAVPELVGLSEAARMLGLSKPAASKRSRRPDFPAPVALLDSGPVWRAEDVRRYARQRAEVFHERAGVQELAAEGLPAAEPGLSAFAEAAVLPVERVADMFGVSAAALRELHRRVPGLPARFRARDGELLGIPADGLGVWGRYLAPLGRETTAAGWSR